MDALKARNKRISNQNLSETVQNPARYFEKSTLAHSMKAVPGQLYEKER